VTSWGGHDPAYPRASRPAGLLREIEARFGPHPAFANDYEIVWYRPHAIDALADALVVGARRRADIAVWLQAGRPDWQLFVTVLSEPHSANEAFWHGIDERSPVAAAPTLEQAGRRLLEVYRAVDDALGRILGALPDDTATVVFSMHGSARNDADVASMVLLPELLYRLHTGRPFLCDPDQAAWAGAGWPVVIPDPTVSWDAHMEGALPHVDADRGSYGEDADGIPDDAGRVGPFGVPIPEEANATPREIGVPWQPVDWQVATWYQHRWPAMRAFALPTFYDGRVRINLAGRERDGIVPLGDYERACDEVEEMVAACRDPRTGQPVLAETVRLRAGDPLDPEGPDADLQLLWSEATDAWVHPVAGTIGPFAYRRMGGHSRRGFAFGAGPGIAPGDIGTRGALDVTPTIVELLGRAAVDGRFEGRSLLADRP
jgi:predicted AlkP superfamily phosphohydrolase/phosphomutase